MLNIPKKQKNIKISLESWERESTIITQIIDA